MICLFTENWRSYESIGDWEWAMWNKQRFVENDSDLVHGLLEAEDASVRSSHTKKNCIQFDNNRVTLFIRPKPINSLDIMQNGFCYIVYQRSFYTNNMNQSVKKENESSTPNE